MESNENVKKPTVQTFFPYIIRDVDTGGIYIPWVATLLRIFYIKKFEMALKGLPGAQGKNDSVKNLN